MNEADLKQLLLIIERQLDWGDSATWQSKDFEILNQLIFEKTKVSLSASTLRRIWGRVEYNHLPSGTTLDTLAQFAGFENRRAFVKNKPAAAEPAQILQPRPFKRPQRNLKLLISAVVVITVSFAAVYIKNIASPDHAAVLSFDTKLITRTIPNSVVFTYDVKTNPTDSVFIQQSWDNTTRAAVDKNQHQYTSIYYVPGFYHAKLLVNNKVVKERLLMIPTNGWLGMIAHYPVPVYLNDKEFKNKDGLQVPVSTIIQKDIPLGPQPPAVEYYNVGNFEPVPLKDLNFEVEVKNDYHEGAATCQYLNIILYTDYTPVIIPLSAKGCVSDLRLLNGRFFVSGKDHDLSGFGADLSQWVKVTCRSVGGKIQYHVNDKLAYESELPLYNENVVGMGYDFQGTGSVKGIRLKNAGKMVFQSF
ncbi:MAG: hypothetical protein ACHQHN_16680 [Sphingobacteriales bacterium]